MRKYIENDSSTTSSESASRRNFLKILGLLPAALALPGCAGLAGNGEIPPTSEALDANAVRDAYAEGYRAALLTQTAMPAVEVQPTAATTETPPPSIDEPGSVQGNREIEGEEDDRLELGQAEPESETNLEYRQITETISVAGFPHESFPVRWGNGVFQSNESPNDATAWILGDPGVISFDYPNGHDENNPSAVWTGGANVDNLVVTQNATFTVPEGGYSKITLPQAELLLQQLGIGLRLDAAPETAYTVVIRGLYPDTQTPEDRNAVMDINTEHPGRVKVMRYPVPADANGFFSYVHLMEDLDTTATGLDNCGDHGCPNRYVILVDLNRDNNQGATLAVLRHTEEKELEVIYSNAHKPGETEAENEAQGEPQSMRPPSSII